MKAIGITLPVVFVVIVSAVIAVGICCRPTDIKGFLGVYPGVGVVVGLVVAALLIRRLWPIMKE
jgi:hypothetical protein